VTDPQHFTSPAGTWDDWLVARPSPVPDQTGAARLTDADWVAEHLHRGIPGMLDFGMPNVRDGIRDLLAEFERDVAGQEVRFRMPTVQANQVSVNAVVIGEQVRVIMGRMKDGQPVGEPLFVDLGVGGAAELCQRILDAPTRSIQTPTRTSSPHRD